MRYLLISLLLVGCSRPHRDVCQEVDYEVLDDKVNREIGQREQLQTEVQRLRSQAVANEKRIATTLTKMAQLEKQLAEQIDGLRAAYVVQAGDTLEKIARQHHSSIRAIKRANHLSKDTIYPGQKLVIPKGASG